MRWEDDQIDDQRLSSGKSGSARRGEGADLCSINTVFMMINDQDAHDGDDHDEEDNERAKYNISRIIFTSLLGRWW